MEMMEVAVFPTGCKMFWGVPETDECNICQKEKAEIAFKYADTATYATRCRKCVKIFFEKLSEPNKTIGLKALEGL